MDTQSSVVATPQEVADAIRRNLVCCDIYHRLQIHRDNRTFKTSMYRGHDICYWAELSALIAESLSQAEMNQVVSVTSSSVRRYDGYWEASRLELGRG